MRAAEQSTAPGLPTSHNDDVVAAQTEIVCVRGKRPCACLCAPLGVSAGLDDVAAVDEPVDDRGAETWVVTVVVQPLKLSLEAIATDLFSSRPGGLVTGDGHEQDLVRSLHELLDQIGRRIADAEAKHDGLGA